MHERVVVIERAIIKEFLNGYFTYLGLERPAGISEDAFVECFCEYVENDYYEWFNDNFRSFFDTGYPYNFQNPDWDMIRKMVKNHSK